MVKSPIKIIDSGTAPTTENLGEGQIAFGTVDGATKLYGSDGTAVSELGGGGGTEVNSIAPAKVSVGAESFDGGSYDSLAIGNNARADLDEVQYHAGSSLAVGNNSIASDQGSTAIGVSSNAISGMAIGYNSRARNNGTALGRTAKAEGLNSVAIGSNSEATLENELSIGSDSLQRRITHVSDPTNDQDAATKAYVDSKITDTGWQEITDSSGSGLKYLTGPWAIPSGSSLRIRKFGTHVTVSGVLQCTEDIAKGDQQFLLSIPSSDSHFNELHLPDNGSVEIPRKCGGMIYITEATSARPSFQAQAMVSISDNGKAIAAYITVVDFLYGYAQESIPNGSAIGVTFGWDTEA